jgi:RNA polymerase sigma factor for flagellar operon FliA
VYPLEPAELLTANLALIERAIAYAGRRYRLEAADVEEFGAIVRLRLCENDFAILRAWEGRSQLATYISIVVQRMALDYRIHEWGKWHPSAEAKRLGPLALELEQLLHRDGRSFEEVLTMLAAKHEVTRTSLQQLAAKLPPRAPKPRDVPLDEVQSASRIEDVEERALDGDRRRVAKRVSAVLGQAIEQLPEDDRLLLKLRFQDGMSVANIARSMQVEQRFLYRRIETRMRQMKAALEREGIEWSDVLDLIGREETGFALRFENRTPRPSMSSDEKAARSEASG